MVNSVIGRSRQAAHHSLSLSLSLSHFLLYSMILCPRGVCQAAWLLPPLLVAPQFLDVFNLDLERFYAILLISFIF